jgi:hypothetical protein
VPISGILMPFPSGATATRATPEKVILLAALTLHLARQFDVPVPLRFNYVPRGSSALAAGQLKRHVRPEGA